LSSSVCEHPGLKSLYEKIVGTEDDSYTHEAMEEVIDALTIFGPGPYKNGGPTREEHPGFLLCPHCKALVALDNFRSGELWNAKAIASRKKALEAEAHFQAIREQATGQGSAPLPIIVPPSEDEAG